jgi:hypothetical protein
MATTEEDDQEGAVVFRQHRREADLPKEDLFGRKQLHGFGLVAIMKVIAGAGVPFEAIPGEFWTPDSDDDGFSLAVIACPCGHTPRVYAGSLIECECVRGYAFTGTEIYVLNPVKPSLPGFAAAS